MKKAPLILLLGIAAAATVHSQDKPILTAPRIIGRIPDGTVPPPPPPKPVFTVPAENILATTTHQQGGRTITLQKIKPIPLPAPAEPAPLATDAPSAPLRLATTRPQTHHFSLGATVYHPKDSPPRTLVHYRPGGDAEPVAFWSSADFSLLAGITAFADAQGQTHSFSMAWSNMNTAPATGKIPEFPAGKATYILLCDPPSAEILAIIQTLHDLYNQELPRLETARQGREAARLQREAELKANPPQPQNITLNYWRIPSPAKGGAQ